MLFFILASPSVLLTPTALLSGFAASQAAYERSYKELFSSLLLVDDILSRQRYIAGNRLTEADIRLWTTLIRFDAVYVAHFRCNKKNISQYEYIFEYMKELYQLPGIKDTVKFDDIKKHYFMSHTDINPKQIIPLGPEVDLDSPHKRGSFVPIGFESKKE